MNHIYVFYFYLYDQIIEIFHYTFDIKELNSFDYINFSLEYTQKKQEQNGINTLSKDKRKND